jgi:hypothetical protein
MIEVDLFPVARLRFNRPRRNRRGPERSLPAKRQFVSSNNMKRTNAHLDDDLYSIQAEGRSEYHLVPAISPKSNPVIRVAVRGTSVVTVIGIVIHK